MSAGFSESALEKKLSELNNSQHSIQTLSLWVIHHRKHHKAIVQVWFKELKKAAANRRLTFIYLANDVIQNSRKKGNEYIKEFNGALPKALAYVIQQADEKTKGSLERILGIWQERNIYDKSQIDKFRQAIVGKRRKTASTPETKNEEPPPIKKKKQEMISLRDDEDKESKTPPGDPPDGDELIKALLDLENSASTDAVVREKIASLPPEVSDASLLDKIKDKNSAEQLSRQVEEALSLLSDYNMRLSQEQEDRRQVARMLADFTHAQRTLLTSTERKLEEYRDKLKKVNQVRSELKSHLQKLPDLSLLPNVTRGLAPLPSAGDLFSRH